MLPLSCCVRCSTRRRVPVRTRAAVDFDFGVSPVTSPPTVVHLMLYNDGDTPTEWYAVLICVCERREIHRLCLLCVCGYRAMSNLITDGLCWCVRTWPVCRAFQFPEDMYLEPEYWADKGELDEVEQHEVTLAHFLQTIVCTHAHTHSPVSCLCVHG